MRIETNSIKSNVLSTAILTHIIIAVAVPACAAVSIIFMGGKHGKTSGLSDELFFNQGSLNMYIFIISLIGISAAFLFIYFKNYKKKAIVAVEFNDTNHTLEIFYKSYYNNKIRTATIPYQRLSYQSNTGTTNTQLPNFSPVSAVNSNDLLINDRIIFLDNKKYIAEISLGGTYWNKEGAKVKMILQKIDEINNEPPVS